MGTLARQALGAALACYAFSNAAAAPKYSILYHESIRLEVHQVSGHTRSMTFEAYGRHFTFRLQPNEAVLRAVPAGRIDIEPLRGQIEGLSKSWVRMTHTRTGWHGMLSDGQELYAIETAADVEGSVVQPLGDTSASAPVIYRLKDALLPDATAFCEILNADGTPYVGTDAQGSVSAKALVNSIVKDAVTFPNGPDLELTVGVVADYEFYQTFTDPEGAIISRWDIVDGIWSNQVGVKMSLAPLTVLKVPQEPFTKTAPADLLAQVRQYRDANASQSQTGVTHLMTGRDLDGDVVGIAYMNSVCNGDAADSLSEGTHSVLESALIAAHELGHNFNAPHDGEAGACSSTPQTFLMAPKINYSDQFSSCSLVQINARIKTASCVVPYEAPDVQVELPATLVGAVANSTFTISFVAHAIGDDQSNAVTANAELPENVTFQSAAVPNGTCTNDSGTVSCTLGTMLPQETRQVDLTLVGNAAGTTTATLSVASPNDTVSTNNSAQVSIQISAAPPTTTTPVAATSSGSSSGGGELDLGILGMLAGATAFAAKRRTRIAATAPRTGAAIATKLLRQPKQR
jgi:Metallo-peptidase family M12/Domain of unknown function DUF11